MDIKFTAQFEIIRDKPAALYKQLNVTGDPDYFSLNGCNYTKNTKKVTGILQFDTCNKWVPLKHQIGKFLTIATQKDRFFGLSATKTFLDIDEASPPLEQTLRAATKLNRGLPTNGEMETVPLMELPS